MAKPSPSPREGWTPELLKEYIDSLFAERLRALQVGDQALRDHVSGQVGQLRDQATAARELTDSKFEASAEAIEKAEAAAEKRFESVNEFRGQLADQAATFLPRETFESILEQWATWRQQVDQRLNTREGQQQGTDHLVRMVFLAIGAVGTALGIIVVLANHFS